MGDGAVELVVLGVAQDGGVPQAGCSCVRCVAALEDPELRLFPVSCAVCGIDGSLHLIEVSRAIPEQLGILSRRLGLDRIAMPETVCLTHAHLGHIDGLGQFGKEAMGMDSVPLYASDSVLEVVEKRGLSSPFESRRVGPSVGFRPSDGCGFEFALIPVPHRDEESDTHAVLISGPNSVALFLPDHDEWESTLELQGATSIRGWLSELGVDIALIDGTFWDSSELPGRDISKIPHPTIADTLGRLGRKSEGDPQVQFLHINHSNPVLNDSSKQAKQVESMGWSVARQSAVFLL